MPTAQRHIPRIRLALAGSSTPSFAPCADWDPGFQSPGVIRGGFPEAVVRACVVFDDDGATRYGAARLAASGAPTRVARWNGTSWTNVGETLVDEEIQDLVVFGAGTPDGVALYAAGRSSSIRGVPASNLARFDGAHGAAVGGGTNRIVRVPCVWNDGSDAAADLDLGGDFERGRRRVELRRRVA